MDQGRGSKSGIASRCADGNRVEQRSAERTADLRRGVHDRRGHACFAWVAVLKAGTITQEIRGRVLAGLRGERLAEEYRTQARRAFARLERGLGDYAVKR